MKKVVVWLMSLAAVLTLCVTAKAEPGVAEVPVIHKEYLTAAGTKPATFPQEELTFEVLPKEGNPDNTLIRIENFTVTQNPADIPVTIPVYQRAGKYNYTVKEVAGDSQGATYTEETFDVQVLAYWNEDHTKLETAFAFTTQNPDATEKIDTLTNQYDLCSLEISKQVTGNLGDRNTEFLVDVTFDSSQGKVVRSDITYLDGEKTEVIPASLLADGSETVTISLKHGETVVFQNIPYGMECSVREQDYTMGEADGTRGYDIPAYGVNDKPSQESCEGIFETLDTDTEKVVITNNRGATVDTGVVLEMLPYCLILLVMGVGFVCLITRKRHTAE